MHGNRISIVALDEMSQESGELPRIPIDSLRALVRPDQLAEGDSHVPGLRVITNDDASWLDLDESDPIFVTRKQHAAATTEDSGLLKDNETDQQREYVYGEVLCELAKNGSASPPDTTMSRLKERPTIMMANERNLSAASKNELSTDRANESDKRALDIANDKGSEEFLRTSSLVSYNAGHSVQFATDTQKLNQDQALLGQQAICRRETALLDSCVDSSDSEYDEKVLAKKRPRSACRDPSACPTHMVHSRECRSASSLGIDDDESQADHADTDTSDDSFTIQNDSEVQYRPSVENCKLASTWGTGQRERNSDHEIAASRKPLPSKRKTKLPCQKSFRKNIERLLNFNDQKGHTMVPFEFECSDGFRLGYWVAKMRKLYKKQKLSDERIEQLNKVGFAWIGRKRVTRSPIPWIMMYKRLCQYKSKHGHVNISKHGNDSDLYAWLASQRLAWRRGALLSGRLQKLKDVGVVPNLQSSPQRHVVPSLQPDQQRKINSQQCSSLGAQEDLRALERHLLSDLDTEIRQAEEEEAMLVLKFDVCLAELNEQHEMMIGHPVGVLTKNNILITGDKRQRMAHVGLIEKSVEEQSVTTSIRMLPGKLECGVQCEILADEFLQRDIVLPFLKQTNKLELPGLGFSACLEQIDEGINAVRLRVEGQEEIVVAFADHMKVWLRTRVFRLSVAHLIKYGKDLHIDLDSNTPLGCSVANIPPSSGVMIKTVEPDGQLQRIVPEAVARINCGALIRSVNGKRCSNVTELKERISSGQRGKTKITIAVDPRLEDKQRSFRDGVAVVLASLKKERSELRAKRQGDRAERLLDAVREVATVDRAVTQDTKRTRYASDNGSMSSSQVGTAKLALGVDPGLEEKVSFSREVAFVLGPLQAEGHGQDDRVVVPAVEAMSPLTMTNEGSMVTERVLPQRREDSSNADRLLPYKRFKELFSQVAAKEFEKSGISTIFALGQMWKRHKIRYGTRCNEDCLCILNLGALMESVVLEQIKKKPKWKPKDLVLHGGGPVGFASNFASRFSKSIQDTWQGSYKPSRKEFLKHLLAFWELHVKQISQTCPEGCRCGAYIGCWVASIRRNDEGKLGKVGAMGTRNETSNSNIASEKSCQQQPIENKKREAEMNRVNETCPHGTNSADESRLEFDMDSNRGRAKAPLHASVLNEEADFVLPRKKRKIAEVCGRSTSVDGAAEYSIECNAANPLGLYVVTVTTGKRSQCKVVSVHPGSQCKREGRLNAGTVIVASSSSHEGVRQAIFTHNDLRLQYRQAKDEGIPLTLWLINSFVTAESVKYDHDKDWTKSGYWRGPFRDGWDGSILQIAPRTVVDLDSAPQDELDIKSSALCDSDVKFVIVDEPRLLVTKPSKSVAAWQKGPSCDVNKSFRFSEVCQERWFYKTDRCCRFEVLSGDIVAHIPSPALVNSPSVQDRPSLHQAVETDTYKAMIPYLNGDGPFSDLTSRHCIELLDSINERRKLVEGDDDLDRKSKLLKIAIHMRKVVEDARSLRHWVAFKIRFDRLDEVDAHQGIDNFVVKWLVNKPDISNKPRVAAETLGLQNFSEENAISFYYNPLSTNGRSFDIEVRGFDPERKCQRCLGVAELKLSDVHMKCSKSGTWKQFSLSIAPSCQKLVRAKGHVFARRVKFPLEQFEAKQQHAITKMKEVIEWITRFNKENDCDLSFDMKDKKGSTLLQAAVLLRDLGMVRHLLDLGADPLLKSDTGCALSMAKNMEDGFVSRGASGESDQQIEKPEQQMVIEEIVRVLYKFALTQNCVEEGKGEESTFVTHELGHSTDCSSEPSVSHGRSADDTVPSMLQSGPEFSSGLKKRVREESHTAATKKRRIVPDVSHEVAQLNADGRREAFGDGKNRQRLDSIDSIRHSWAFNGKRGLCRFFARGCIKGASCNYAHSALDLLAMERTCSALSESQISKGLMFQEAEYSHGAPGYTAAFRHPMTGVIYFAEGGDGHRNFHGVWFYRDRGEARKAVLKVLSS